MCLSCFLTVFEIKNENHGGPCDIHNNANILEIQN